MNNLKIYKVDAKDIEGTQFGLSAISLVDFPAVEKNFLTFSKEDEPLKVALSLDDEQHIITGVALLADTPIYRQMQGGCYIVFTKESIRQLVQKYSRDGLLNAITLQHDADTHTLDKCTMIESYFTDKGRGIAPVEFSEIPDGSWIVSFKVEDGELWDAVKASHGEKGGLNGFSIEAYVPFVEAAKEDPVPEDYYTQFDEINNL